MSEQTMLSSFSDKTVLMTGATKGFRPWDRTIFEWEIRYRGYNREEDGPTGFVNFHVTVEIKEAMVIARKPKSYKKVKMPGYRLVVTQNASFEGGHKVSYIVHDETFKKHCLKKAFDAFQRELMNIQCWVEIAESRARIIPQANDLFECLHCGWMTDIWADDITCEGCGKRYWSERLWRKM